jgi:hypothetical protein
MTNGYALKNIVTCFSQLLNIHWVRDVRQIEVHTAEPSVPNPSSFVVEIATTNLKRYKLLGSDQIPAELIQAGGETMRSQIHKLINSISNKEELPDQWEESINVPIYKKGDKTDYNNLTRGYHRYQLDTKFYPVPFFQG